MATGCVPAVRCLGEGGFDKGRSVGRFAGELAFHYCFVPAGQPVSLSWLIRAAGLRWPAEEDFRSGKGCFGLDQSQVRLYHAIARPTALVLAALAVGAVTAALLRRRTGTRAPAPVRPGQPRPPTRE